MKRLAFNSLVLILGNFTNAALVFVLSVVVGRALGVAEFGRYSLALAWALSLGLFADLGLATLLTRDLARQPGATASYLMTSSLIKSVVSIVCMVMLWVAAPYTSSDATTVIAIRLAVPLIWINSLYSSLTAIFRAFQRMMPILVLNVGTLLLQIVFSLALIARGGHAAELVGVAVVVQAAQLAAAFGIFLLRYRLPPDPSLIFNLSALARQMLRDTIPFAIAGLLGALQLRANVLMLGSIQGDRGVGLFGAASRWTEVAKMGPNGFFGALFPALSSLAAKDTAELERTFRRAERAMLFFGIIGAPLLYLAAPVLIRATYGDAFSDAVPVLQILGWQIVPYLWNGIMGLYLYALGDEHFVNAISTAGIIVLVTTGVPLVMNWGASGAAIAALLSEAAMTVLFRGRCLKLQQRSIKWKTLGSTD